MSQKKQDLIIVSDHTKMLTGKDPRTHALEKLNKDEKRNCCTSHLKINLMCHIH